MQYETFGNTDLCVSKLCQGTAFRHLPRIDDPIVIKVLKQAFDLGVTFFDSAIAYRWGGAERALGQALDGNREDAVICTKVPIFLESGEQMAYNSDYLRSAVEGSLKRLKTDYLDLFLLHHVDEYTPVNEQCDGMQELVEKGLIRYWGLSNHDTKKTTAFLRYARIAGIEEYYNIAGESSDASGRNRTSVFECELQPLLIKHQLGCLAFSPLDTGSLAKPCISNQPLMELITTIDKIAADFSTTRAAICIAWVVAQKGITSVLCGAESIDQIETNASGVQLQLSDTAWSHLNQARRCYIDAWHKQRH